MPSDKNSDRKTERNTNAYDKSFEQLLMSNGKLSPLKVGYTTEARKLGGTERDTGQGLDGTDRA